MDPKFPMKISHTDYFIILITLLITSSYVNPIGTKYHAHINLWQLFLITVISPLNIVITGRI